MTADKLQLGLLAGALALAACAGVSADFVKQGATKAQVRADNAACREEAEARVGRDAVITHDIRVGSRRDTEDSAQLLRQTRDVDIERRYDRIFTGCMTARGYTRKSN